MPYDKLLCNVRHYGIREDIRLDIHISKIEGTELLVDGKHSNGVRVDSSIPQGTVLDLLLFLPCINDLPKWIIKQSTIFLFVDDYIMYRNIKKIQDQIDFQKDQETLKEWGDRWGMKYKPFKCQLIRINQSKHSGRMVHIVQLGCSSLLILV